MRQIHKQWDERVIQKFAFLPVHTDTETRWLEFVKVEQQYSLFHGWVNKRFL